MKSINIKKKVKEVVIKEFDINVKEYRSILDSIEKVCTFAISNGGVFYVNGWFKVSMTDKSSKFFNLKNKKG